MRIIASLLLLSVIPMFNSYGISKNGGSSFPKNFIPGLFMK